MAVTLATGGHRNNGTFMLGNLPTQPDWCALIIISLPEFEDTTHFGQKTQRHRTGTDLEAFSITEESM